MPNNLTIIIFMFPVLLALFLQIAYSLPRLDQKLKIIFLPIFSVTFVIQAILAVKSSNTLNLMDLGLLLIFLLMGLLIISMPKNYLLFTSAMSLSISAFGYIIGTSLISDVTALTAIILYTTIVLKDLFYENISKS